MDQLDRAAEQARQDLLRATDTVTPPSAETVIRRAQRRRQGRMAAGVAVAALVVGSTVVWLRPGGDDRSKVVAGQPATTTTEAPLVAAPPPGQVVVIEPASTGRPGAMVVLDVATGAVVRTLGADYGIYPSNGFQVTPDGRTLYWNRLNEPAQKIELVRQPIDGGTASVAVPNGAQPRFTSDGALMVFQSAGNPVGFVRRDLTSGADRDLPTPGEAGEVVVNTAFEQGRRTLVAITTRPVATCSGPGPGPNCPPSSPSPFHGWTIDVDDPGATWKPFATTATWDGGILLGPGPDPGSILLSRSEQPSGTRIAEVTADGTVPHEIQLPSGYRPLNVDRTGTNILVASDNALARVTLADPRPVRIAGPARLATW